MPDEGFQPKIAAIDVERAPTAGRTLVLAACMMATFMAAVESSIVATAMPTIVADLGGFNLFSWVFAVYLLTQAVSIPIYGRLADIYGRKNVFYVGAGLFLVGSTLCGFAGNLADADLVPRAARLRRRRRAADRNHHPGRHLRTDRARARAGSDVQRVRHRRGTGPFARCLPGRTGKLAARVLGQPADRRGGDHHDRDIPARAGGASSASQHRLSRLAAADGGDHRADGGPGAGRQPVTAALAIAGAIGIAALVALVVHELGTPEPMLPLELWRQHRVIVVGSIGGAVISAVMTGVSAFLPTYVQGAMGRSALAGGLVLGAMSVTWAVASFYGGRLMVRTTYRLTAVLGTLALIAGSVVLITLTPERGVAWASTGSLLIGIGMGLCNTTFIVSIQAAVPWHQRGAATSSCMFLRFVGQSLGVAMFGAVLNLTLLRKAPEAVSMIDRLLDPVQRGGLAAAELARLTDVVAMGLHNTYVLAGVLSVLALGFALLLPARLSPARQAQG